jgi:hypothetical protein
MTRYECNVNEVGPAADGTETPDPVVYIKLTDTGGVSRTPGSMPRTERGNRVLDVGIAAISANTSVSNRKLVVVESARRGRT